MITLIFIALGIAAVLGILLASSKQTTRYIVYKSHTKYGTLRYPENSKDVEYFRQRYINACSNPAPNAILVDGAVYFPYGVEEVDSKGRVVNTTKLI